MCMPSRVAFLVIFVLLATEVMVNSTFSVVVLYERFRYRQFPSAYIKIERGITAIVVACWNRAALSYAIHYVL